MAVSDGHLVMSRVRLQPYAVNYLVIRTVVVTPRLFSVDLLCKPFEMSQFIVYERCRIAEVPSLKRFVGTKCLN
jgi:hypothetical protein